MIPNIFCILPLLQFVELAENFINENVNSDNNDDNIHEILSFINIIHPILDILINILEMTKDRSRENDAYKLIRYCAEYR